MDLASIQEDMAREILRQAEQFVAGQVSFALAADQRAATLSAVFSTAAIAAIGFALIQSGPPSIAGSVTGLLLALGALFCVVALRPVGMFTVGNEPKSWLREEVTLGSLATAMAGESRNYQKRIDYNKKILKRNAMWFKIGASLGCVSPLIGLASYFLASYLVTANWNHVPVYLP